MADKIAKGWSVISGGPPIILLVGFDFIAQFSP
jgi:hypothetical protein